MWVEPLKRVGMSLHRGEPGREPALCGPNLPRPRAPVAPRVRHLHVGSPRSRRVEMGIRIGEVDTHRIRNRSLSLD
eukprot:scaffold4174_cov229-Prasinococcus_capsulatus_cf.AAC.1